MLPVGETTRFNLHSPDVIHDFGVPDFLMKMDVIPGRVNHFEVTPKTEGTYVGKCSELCGVYHSRMLFNVKVVTPEHYDEYVADLAADKTSTGPAAGARRTLARRLAWRARTSLETPSDRHRCTSDRHASRLASRSVVSSSAS